MMGEKCVPRIHNQVSHSRERQTDRNLLDFGSSTELVLMGKCKLGLLLYSSNQALLTWTGKRNPMKPKFGCHWRKYWPQCFGIGGRSYRWIFTRMFNHKRQGYFSVSPFRQCRCYTTKIVGTTLGHASAFTVQPRFMSMRFSSFWPSQGSPWWWAIYDHQISMLNPLVTSNKDGVCEFFSQQQKY